MLVLQHPRVSLGCRDNSSTLEWWDDSISPLPTFLRSPDGGMPSWFDSNEWGRSPSWLPHSSAKPNGLRNDLPEDGWVPSTAVSMLRGNSTADHPFEVSRVHPTCRLKGRNGMVEALTRPRPAAVLLLSPRIDKITGALACPDRGSLGEFKHADR